jgi:hypothetical protein
MGPSIGGCGVPDGGHGGQSAAQAEPLFARSRLFSVPVHLLKRHENAMLLTTFLPQAVHKHQI